MSSVNQVEKSALMTFWFCWRSDWFKVLKGADGYIRNMLKRSRWGEKKAGSLI